MDCVSDNEINLYDMNPTKLWSDIAHVVPYLDTEDESFAEQMQNVEILQRLLAQLGINVYTSIPESSFEQQVGLYSLLQGIYDISNDKYRGQVFIDLINQLRVLGITHVSFDSKGKGPVPLIEELEYEDNPDYTRVVKVYTDGIFSITHDTQNANQYCIENLDDLSYYLYILHQYNKKDGQDYYQAAAVFRNFRGILPNKEEILSMSFPQLLVENEVKPWTTGEKVKIYQKEVKEKI